MYFFFFFFKVELTGDIFQAATPPTEQHLSWKCILNFHKLIHCDFFYDNHLIFTLYKIFFNTFDSFFNLWILICIYFIGILLYELYLNIQYVFWYAFCLKTNSNCVTVARVVNKIINTKISDPVYY